MSEINGNGRLNYYKWMHIVKFIGLWDREGSELIKHSQMPPCAPGKPSEPQLPRQSGYKNDDGEWRSAEHKAIYKEHVRNYKQYKKDYPKLHKEWKKNLAEHEAKMVGWKPSEEPEFDPVDYPFLALRLRAMVSSEKHRERAIKKCNDELEYCRGHNVNEETMPTGENGHISGEDIKALRQIKEVVENAELGKELV